MTKQFDPENLINNMPEKEMAAASLKASRVAKLAGLDAAASKVAQATAIGTIIANNCRIVK